MAEKSTSAEHKLKTDLKRKILKNIYKKKKNEKELTNRKTCSLQLLLHSRLKHHCKHIK